MSPIPSRFDPKKISPRLLQVKSDRSIYADHHATVSCQECSRIMVPRVITYYGQAHKSICPFCGTTFMKFPSGLQQFIENFHIPNLSFAAFKRLMIAALCFGLLWLIGVLANFPDELSFLGTLGTIIFGAFASAELLAQCIEQLAAKFSHESKYYWAASVGFRRERLLALPG